MTERQMGRAIQSAIAALMLAGCVGLPLDIGTPGERFRAGMRTLESGCAKASPRELEGDNSCDKLKLRPRDWEHTTFVNVDGQPLPVPQEWVATPEGRFAHAIRLPEPLSVDSGYRINLSSEQYFQQLCAKEAGQFVYKVVENVDGIYQGRPRDRVKSYPFMHLYAIEDPAGINVDDVAFGEPWTGWIGFERYHYLETPAIGPVDSARWSKGVDPSMREPAPPDAKISRYIKAGAAKNEITRREFAPSRQARYGYVWRGIRREMDRELGIAGGELIALDFSNNEVLGVFRYYTRARLAKGVLGVAWDQSCPQLLRGESIPQFHMKGFEFLSAVLRPTIELLKRYRVVHHQSNTPSAFSATLVERLDEMAAPIFGTPHR
jgi:hypothetical protein